MGYAPLAVIVILAWFLGTFSGALWMAALEREDHKKARPYGHYMLYCYSVCLLAIALWKSLS